MTAHRQIQVKMLSIMVSITLVVTTAAFWTLYRVVLERTEVQLVELVASQSRLMEAVAKFDAIHSEGVRVARANTLSQIRESHYRYRGFGETGEIVMGQRVDSTIHFLLPEPSLGFDVPEPVLVGSGAAEPMVRATAGESGVMRGADFSGADVLAAYEWLPFLGVGLVAKVQMREIRFPFFNAAIVTSIFALLSLVFGTFFHRRMVDPLVVEVFNVNEQLKEREAKLSNLSTQLSRYLSPQLYRSMFEGTSEAKIFTQRKKLTVFFSDVVGFTSRTDHMEPEDLSYQLNSYFDSMARIVNRHGGTLDKFIGDAVLVFFGDPESRGVKEDALACLDMAWEMRAEIDRLCVEWAERGLDSDFQVRVGITTGYCTVGNFGSESRMEYTILGNEVNLASRIEGAARPGEILVSEGTYTLISSHWECIEKDLLNVKGFDRSIRSFEVAGPRSASNAPGVRVAGAGYAVTVDPSAVTREEREKARRSLREALELLEDGSDSDE